MLRKYLKDGKWRKRKNKENIRVCSELENITGTTRNRRPMTCGYLIKMSKGGLTKKIYNYILQINATTKYI